MIIAKINIISTFKNKIIFIDKIIYYIPKFDYISRYYIKLNILF